MLPAWYPSTQMDSRSLPASWRWGHRRLPDKRREWRSRRWPPPGRWQSHLFCYLAHFGHLFLCICVWPHIPTDGVPRIFVFSFLNSYAAAGNRIRIFWGTLIRTLYRLSYSICGDRIIFENIASKIAKVFPKGIFPSRLFKTSQRNIAKIFPYSECSNTEPIL